MSKVFGDQELFGKLFPRGESPRSAHESLGYSSLGQIDLAVNGGTGSDTPTGTRPARLVAGDYQAEPFATIQAAIDSLPPICKHRANIYVAAGSYAGFQFKGFNTPSSVIVHGVQETVTPTSGSATGTATSGTSKSLTVTSAGWTVDDFQGKFCKITAGTGAGQHFIIAGNTADTLNFAGPMNPAPNGTSQFEITEPTTILTSGEATYGAGVLHTGSIGTAWVYDFHVDGPSYGFLNLFTNSSLGLRRCTTDGGWWGFVGQNALECSWAQIGALNSGDHGIQFLGVTSAANSGSANGWLVINPGNNGLYLTNCLLFGVDGLWVESSGQSGVWIIDQASAWMGNLMVDGGSNGLYMNRAHLRLHNGELKNNTTSGIRVNDMAKLEVSGSLTGTGNGAWGMDLSGNSNNRCGLLITPTLTGTSGDATVDGSTAKSWNPDLDNAGEYVERAGYGTRIVRT